jgi:hypothetical protein
MKFRVSGLSITPLHFLCRNDDKRSEVKREEFRKNRGGLAVIIRRMAHPALWGITFILLLLFTATVRAGTLTGQVIEENGEPMECVLVLGYTGNDPERPTAMPDELSLAFQARTDNSGNFSLTIPDTVKTFNLKIKIDTAIYNPIHMKGIENREGSFTIGEPFVAISINNEPFWISSDANAQVPNTLSTNTNRWEQLKVRGKLLPIYFREAKIEPLTVTANDATQPVLHGLPTRKQ